MKDTPTFVVKVVISCKSGDKAVSHDPIFTQIQKSF